MTNEYDPSDPEAAMRDMMGFSGFSTSGSKGGRKKTDNAPPKPSTPSLTGSNTQPLSKRLKPTPTPTPNEPSYSATSADATMARTNVPSKSTSPPPYIPPTMYPAHILPPKPNAAAMLNIPAPQPSPTHSTHSAVSDARPFTGVSAGPPLHPSPLSTGATGNVPDAGPRMTTYNAANTSGGGSKFTSQDIRFAPPPAEIAEPPPPGTENSLGQDYPPRDPYEKQYARDGVSYMCINEQGDTAFFKPSFIVDDPWTEVREWKQHAKAMKRNKNRPY